jgi:DNA repair and recombination RAD54-like protein
MLKRHFVVVCPSSLVKNWAHEFDKWIGIACQRKCILVHGGTEGVAQMKAFNVLKPNSQSEVLIISYELFWLTVELLKNT